MEQGTNSQPNLATFNRLTGKAVWFKTGALGGVDLGNIDMYGMDEGIAREKIMLAIDGNVVLGLEEAVSVSPVWTIKGKQYHSSVIPLILMGTRNADVVQTASGSVTLTIPGITLGLTYDIGARNITVASVTVGGAAKTADVDYYLEANKGLIRFPNSAAGIVDGATVVITYSKPAITRETYTAFNNLNETGTLRLFEMDNKSQIPLSEMSLPGTISRDKGSDGDPTKHNQWALRLALNGQPTALRRAA